MSLPIVPGCEWETTSHVYQDKTDLGTIPILVVTDLEKFNTAYNDLALEIINGGQSLRVKCQGIGRTMRWKDRKVSHDELASAIVGNLNGTRRRGSRGPTLTGSSNEALLEELRKRGLNI